MLRQKTYVPHNRRSTPSTFRCRLWKFGQKLGEILCRVEESGEPKMIGKTRGFMGTSPLIKLITYNCVYIIYIYNIYIIYIYIICIL